MQIDRVGFYFLRHGESEFAINPHLSDQVDVSLTPRGRKQAESIQPIIEKLPIQTICVSPLLRAKTTKDIVAQNIKSQFYVIEELRECSGAIWQRIYEREKNPHLLCEEVDSFVTRVVSGINQALSFPGPVLIVAHAGIYFALCHHLNIQDYAKPIDHCVPVHFYPSDSNIWMAKQLATP
jgi:probable phosphoglycerate mutase